MANKEVCRTFSKLSLLKYCLLIVIITQQTSCALYNQNKQSQWNEKPSNILRSEPEKLIEGNDISQNNQGSYIRKRFREEEYVLKKSGNEILKFFREFSDIKNKEEHFEIKELEKGASYVMATLTD